MIPMLPNSKDLTTLDVARRLNVCTETVRRILLSGDLKGYKFGRGFYWRIKETELQKYRDRAVAG